MASRTPTFSEVLATLRDGIFRDLHVSMTAQVVSYDSQAITVTVQPIPADSRVDATGAEVAFPFPQVPGVPWGSIEAGGCHVRVTPEAGDLCTVIFTDRNIDGVLASMSSGVPTDNRRHAIIDAIAYPLLTGTRPANLPSGVVSLGKNTGSDDWVALSSKVHDALEALKTFATTHTHQVAGVQAGASTLPAAPSTTTLTMSTAVASASVNIRG